jgi:14-3-3 protein epsilon
MATHVYEIAKTGLELSAEEQRLFSTAYRTVVGALRTNRHAISSVDELETGSRQKHAAVRQDYRHKIESELEWVCLEVLEVLSTRLIPTATTSLSKILYY